MMLAGRDRDRTHCRRASRYEEKDHDRPSSPEYGKISLPGTRIKERSPLGRLSGAFISLLVASILFVFYALPSGPQDSRPAVKHRDAPRAATSDANYDRDAAFRSYASTASITKHTSPSESRLFHLSHFTWPVEERADLINYSNSPISSFRPQNQFHDLSEVKPKTLQRAYLSIVTIVSGDAQADLIKSTYESLAAQSLSAFRWEVFVPSALPSSAVRKLTHLSERDKRINVRNLPKDLLPSQATGYIVKHLYKEALPYSMFLDPGDMLELTALEKALWTFHSVPNWDLVGFHAVFYGATNTTDTLGLHDAHDQENGRLVANAATIFRTKSLAKCTAVQEGRSPSQTGREWLWSCLASQGYWGGTIPEYNYWRYTSMTGTIDPLTGKSHSSTHDLSVRAEMDQDLAKLLPDKRVNVSKPLEPINDPPDLGMDIAPQKSIMLIQSWMLVGGSELGFLRVVKMFAEAGYRVTIVLLRHQHIKSSALRPQYMQFTHDIHTLPTFLRVNDFQPYVRHLIQTRHIQKVILNNSGAAYDMLPYLKEYLPQVEFFDYLHNEGFDNWKRFGYPTLSHVHQRYLTKTLTCSDHLKQWLVREGGDAERIGVVKLGIPVHQFQVLDENERSIQRRLLNEIKEDTFVIVMTARLDHQKRPDMVPDIIHYLKEDLESTSSKDLDIKVLLLGDGPLRNQVYSRVQYWGLEDTIKLLGTVEDPKAILQVADVFLLPSIMEGISIALAEAMASGLPIVASHVGALPEQLGYSLETRTARAGLLVAPETDYRSNAKAFAQALKTLILDKSYRRELALAARDHVEASFDAAVTLPEFISELELPPKKHSQDSTRLTPNPAAYSANEKMILEDSALTDLRYTQNRLSIAPRTGLASRIAEYCLDDGGTMSQWIDYIVDDKICYDDEEIDRVELARSAEAQCGAHCIWNLKTRNQTGWSFDGSCFTAFEHIEEAAWCERYFHMRPNIDLL